MQFRNTKLFFIPSYYTQLVPLQQLFPIILQMFELYKASISKVYYNISYFKTIKTFCKQKLENRPPCQWGLPQFSTMGAFTQKKPQVLGDKLSTSDTVI